MQDQHSQYITEQPAPINNSHLPVWEDVMREMELARYGYGPELQGVIDDVLNDMDDRNDEGIRRYGTPLQPFNGRNPLIDLYQELLDAAVYSRQFITEIEAYMGDRELSDEFQASYYQICSTYDKIMDSIVHVRSCISITEP